MATISHRVWFRRRFSSPFEIDATHLCFGVVTGFLRKEILWTGVKTAKAARAAESSPLVRIVCAGLGKGQASHHLVGFNGITKKVTRTVLGTVAALIACGFADLRLHFRGLKLPGHHMMGAGEDHDSGRCFCDWGIEGFADLSHHQSSDA